MCDCRKGKNAIPLECDGIHLTTGCIKGGNSIHNHDRVKDQTAKILSYCGLSTTIGGRFFCARTRVRIFFADAIFFSRTRVRAHAFGTQNKKCAGAAWNANYFCALARCERIVHAIRF